MAKQVLFNNSAKKALQKGVNIVADAVGSTLGAMGKTVIISHYHSVPPIVTKDGVTVANSVVLKDEQENVGAMLIREVASKTVKNCGDGTTTSTVLAQAIINEGLKQIAKGANSQEVKSGIDKAVNKVVGELKWMSVNVGDSNEKIKHIATVSANNDKVIGGLIADAYAKIGNNGVLLIEESGIIDTVIEVKEGVEIPRGYINPTFANNKEKMQFVHDDCLVLVVDYTIARMNDLVPILSLLEAAGSGKIQRPILIVAQDYEGELIGSMQLNNSKGVTKCCLGKAPSSYRQESMDDIAILTGATVISDTNGLKMENIRISHLGSAKKIIVTETTTTIVGGAGAKEKVDQHKQEIKIQMDDMKDEALKEVWKIRLGRISGCIGVIKVGGATDVETKEKKDRVDDACRAVKSAIEEGVVVGGGVALVRCINSLKSIVCENDERIGVGIIRKALSVPLKRMLENAGIDHKSRSLRKRVLSFFEESTVDKVIGMTGNNGYNVKAKEFQNLFDNGVIDPTMVVRCALQNAASVGGAVITSDCLVVEMKQD